MNLALLGKFWRDSRWLLLGCVAVSATFAAIRVWLVAQLDTSRFRQILELLPGDFRAWSSVDFEWIVSYPGRLSFIFQEPLVHFCLFVWCIARGSDAVAGELDRGTGEMLLSQPVSRRRYLAWHVSLTLAGVVVIAGAVWGGQALGIHLISAKQFDFARIGLSPSFGIPLPFLKPTERFVPMRELVDVGIMIPATVSFAALGFLMAGFTTLASACDRFRWRTIGIATGCYIVQTILKLLATVVPSLGWLKFTTVFSAFEPEKFGAIADQAPAVRWAFILNEQAASAGTAAHGLGASGAIALLLSLAAVCFVAAFVIFDRRDLPAPI